MKTKLLLDGSKMPERTFNAQFKKIVGCDYLKFEEKEGVRKDCASEWFCEQNDNFILVGTVYEPPKLYRKV